MAGALAVKEGATVGGFWCNTRLRNRLMAGVVGLLLVCLLVGTGRRHLYGPRDTRQSADSDTQRSPVASRVKTAAPPTADSADAIVAPGPASAQTDISTRNITVIHEIPRTRRELELAHDRNLANACENVAAGKPFETTTPSTRRHVFSVGLDMSKQDENSLPLISRGSVVQYQSEHYVSMQARIQRDPLTGAEYLHHRPLAATIKFKNRRITQPRTKAIVSSTRDIRGIGLFLPADAPRTPENLRTMVLAHRNFLAPAGSDIQRVKPDYEYVFVRARKDDAADSSQLALHAFATSGRRKFFHYVNSAAKPRRAAECGIKGTVVFTEFSHGIYPIAAVIRHTSVRAESTFTWSDLDEHVRTQGLTGDALDHLTLVLDAIIDGKIVPHGVTSH